MKLHADKFDIDQDTAVSIFNEINTLVLSGEPDTEILEQYDVEGRDAFTAYIIGRLTQDAKVIDEARNIGMQLLKKGMGATRE
jgi:hypothetical protein